MTIKVYVPYNYETKKFASEWSQGGSSGVNWEDTPLFCAQVSERSVESFKRYNPGSFLSRMIPQLSVAVSGSAKKEIAKCGVVEIEYVWKIVEESA